MIYRTVFVWLVLVFLFGVACDFNYWGTLIGAVVSAICVWTTRSLINVDWRIKHAVKRFFVRGGN